MNYRDFKLDLIEELKTLPYAKYKDKQLAVRCVFCGDSIKHHDSTHLNIRIDPNDEEPLVYRCLRCNSSGLFDSTTMAMIGGSMGQITADMTRYNRVAAKKSGLILNKKGIKMHMPELVLTDSVMEKHHYIENRLGLSLDPHELNEKKIVYDFIGLMKHNHIKELNGSIDWLKALNNEHVGFLSAKNDFINFRDMSGKYKRYYIYKVLKSFDTTGKFYIMPNNLDPFVMENKTINVAEGVFDILGIYYHIFNGENKNMLYTAINGAGYLNVIKYILSTGLLCDVDVNIFSDADRDPVYYKHFVKVIQPFVNDIRLFYNGIGKDYGVPAKEIRLQEKNIH